MTNSVPSFQNSQNGIVSWFSDTISNWISGMMMANRDKTWHTSYTFNQIQPDELESAFRGDWIARKVISIPALDATREWREWQAKQDQIEKLEAAEEQFNLRAKVREALIKARLYGGAGIVIGTTRQNEDTMQPLEPERVGKDGLMFLHVVTRYELAAGELESDITSPYFGVPRYYSVSLTSTRGQIKQLRPSQRIHPSRVVRFIGNDAPSVVQAPDGWGDPVLWVVNDAVRSAGLTTQTIAQLIQEAKIDFIKVPDLTSAFSTVEGSNRYIKRMSAVNAAKSTTNAVMLDKDEEWERTQVSFTGMPEVLQQYLFIASGAADIPATRMLGRSPAGQNATGESDMRNYYDRIRSDQTLRIQPAMRLLDQCIQVHALGKFDEDIFYEWASLWQMDEAQKAQIDKQKAETTKLYVDTGVVPFEALAKGVQNQLIEDGTYPGIEAALQEVATANDWPMEGGGLPPLLGGGGTPMLPAPNGGGGAPAGDEASFGDIGWTEEARQASIEARRANAKEKFSSSDFELQFEKVTSSSSRRTSVRVHVDPAPRRLQQIIEQTIRRGDNDLGELRILKHGDQLLVWNAADATHDMVANSLDMTDWWEESIHHPSVLTKEYAERFKFDLRKLYHDPHHTSDARSRRGALPPASWEYQQRSQRMSEGPYVPSWEQESEKEWFQTGRRKRRKPIGRSYAPYGSEDAFEDIERDGEPQLQSSIDEQTVLDEIRNFARVRAKEALQELQAKHVE